MTRVGVRFLRPELNSCSSFRRTEASNAQDRRFSHADLCSRSVRCNGVGANLRVCRSNIQSGIDGLRVSESQDRTQRQQCGARRDHEQKAHLQQGSKLGQHQFALFGCLHLGRSCGGRIQKVSSELLPTSSGQSRRITKAITEETEKFFSLAPRSQVVVAVQAMCRRYANLSEQCQAMIEGLAASGN